MKLAGKIWRIIYPEFLLFGTYFAVYIVAIFSYGSFFSAKYPDLESFMAAAGDIVSITSLLIGGLVVYYFYRKDYPVEFRTLTGSPKYIIALIILAVLLSHGLNILVSLVNYSGFLGTYSQGVQSTAAAAVIITVIKTVILAPIAEELTFRGLIFRRMEAYTSFWPAALVSSALFALYHMNLLQGIYAFIYGIVLCLIYRKFRNILAPLIMHAAANAFTLVFTYLKLDYPSIPVYIAVMLAALGISAVMYLWIYKSTAEK
ncbi:MAG: CPBP family intramembrane metalloprotease [Lachnospiraceae bacterium]|nr:CPBP family intramembrane metalloprotease [Lachnospiraceae bacterium]